MKKLKHFVSSAFFLVALIGQTPSAIAGGPKCFMHGIYTPLVENKDKTSLSNMIRLQFEATEKKKCEELMSAYCQYHIKDKGYNPETLKGSFKGDMEKSDETKYIFNSKCQPTE